MAVDAVYMRGYMEGYNAAKAEAKVPYVDKDMLIARYNGRIGINKAYEILRAVRRTCGGGKLQSNNVVLLSELEYWESQVDTTYVERL